MDEFLQRLRAFVLGGGPGEGLDPRVTGEAPGFVRDTVMPGLGVSGKPAITGVPGLQTRLAEAMLPGQDRVLGQVPIAGNTYVNPAQPVSEQSVTAGHEIFHELQKAGAHPALMRQLREMYELAKSRDTRSGLDKIRDSVTSRTPSHLVNRYEHGADAVEGALQVLRAPPGNQLYKLRLLEQEIPGTTLAYNFIQRNLR